jgi:hypothetical protein
MNSISNLLKVGKKVDGLGSQRVETRIVEPAQFTQQAATWLLPKTGVLDSNAYVTLGMTAADLSQNLALFAGIYACIDRAVLMNGSEVIAQSDFTNHRMTLQSWFDDPSKRKNIRTTRCGAFQDFMVKNGATIKGQYQLNKNIVGLDTAANGDVTVNSNFQLGTTAATTPEFRIYLSQLFGAINFLNLPLGLIDNQLSLQIFWAADLAGNRTVPKDGSAWSPGNNMVESMCRLVCDLVYWEQQQPNEPTVMEQLEAEMNKGISLTYTDSLAFQTSFPATTVAAGDVVSSEITPQVGMSDQILRRLMIATPRAPDYATNTPANPLLGNYFSEGSQGSEEFQVFVNATPLWAKDLNSDNKIYTQMSQTYGSFDGKPRYLRAPSGLTSWNGQTVLTGATKYNTDISQCWANAAKTNTHLNRNMNGSAHYLGASFQVNYENVAGNGVKVGNNPIKLKMRRDRTNENQSKTDVIVWGFVERYLKILSRRIYVSGAS